MPDTPHLRGPYLLKSQSNDLGGFLAFKDSDKFFLSLQSSLRFFCFELFHCHIFKKKEKRKIQQQTGSWWVLILCQWEKEKKLHSVQMRGKRQAEEGSHCAVIYYLSSHFSPIRVLCEHSAHVPGFNPTASWGRRKFLELMRYWGTV